MSSSEDSFGWTTASNTSASDIMSSNESNQIDYESESNKSYKKKLHKKLFKDTNNIDNSISESKQNKKAKKRKIKEESTDSSDCRSSKKKKIKVEPESDLDTSSVKSNKVKKDNKESIISVDASKEYEYLNKKVKEEQGCFLIPTTPTKKKDSTTNISNSSDNDKTNDSTIETETKRKSKKKKKNKHSTEYPELRDNNHVNGFNDECDQSLHRESGNDDSYCQIKPEGNNLNDEHMETPKKEKKKKKKSKESKRIDNDDEQNESTVFEKSCISPITNKSANSSILHSEKMLQDSDNENGYNNSKNQSKKANSIYNKELSHEESDNQENSIQPINNSILKSAIPITSSKRKRRISEKIRFKNESEDEESEQENTLAEDSVNNHLEKYLQSNPHFKLVKTKMQKGAIITNDDDIWILECPNEIDINMLKDTSLDLENKCKIKINDHTYIGKLDQDPNRITVLSSVKGKHVINNINVNGTIQLHKRKRKQHYVEDNIIVDDNKVIPLPETKCRHPLFGYAYKTAMKLPLTVRESLKETEIPAPKEKKKKSKRKKEKESPEKVKIEEQIKVKKSRKRKHHSEEEHSATVTKKSKLAPDSAEAWESERAIEENLFNF